jgi:nicotinamidase-related amidase
MTSVTGRHRPAHGAIIGAMTTLADRPRTALLVVDVQHGVVDGAPRRDEVVATIAALAVRARAEGASVIWVQHADDGLVAGTPGWELVAELGRRDGEPIVAKHHGDSFEDTTLETELAARGVGRVVVAGAQTDACIRATLHGAFVRGYDTVLVADAHTTEDLTEYGLPAPELVIAHANQWWTWQSGPGREASVEPAADVRFVS